MKIIEQSYEIMWCPIESARNVIELAGRVAYKSEGKIEPGSAEPFIQKVVKSGHLSVIEHGSMTVRFITDRGVSHEIVRHRLASYTQESTRYVNYSNKDGANVTYIRPTWVPKEFIAAQDWGLIAEQWQSGHYTWMSLYQPFDNKTKAWLDSCLTAEEAYGRIMADGGIAQEARAVLNNSTKTEIVMTANFREWRHFFELRSISKAAHPQMRALTIPLYEKMRGDFPEIFDMGDVE